MRKQNTLREKLESGKVVLGGQTVTHSASVVESCGNLGLDFVWIDFEHIGPAPYNADLFEDLVRAADVSGTELLVRIPKSDPSLVRKLLDSSVQNLLIPRIETAAEARQAVKASQFEYGDDVGERGIAASRSSNWGSILNREYIHNEDQNTAVGVMIENMTAVENLEEILSVKNLGFIVIGQADLSVSMGHPLEFDNQNLKNTINQIRDMSLSHGVPVGRVTGNMQDAQEAIENGVQMVRISGGEIGALQAQLNERIRKLDEYR